MNIYPLTPESTKRFASPNTSPIRRESKSPSIEEIIQNVQRWLHPYAIFKPIILRRKLYTLISPIF